VTLINRYIIFESIKYFLLSLVSVLCIFIAIDYLGNMDEFIEADISLWRAFQFVILKVPFICTQTMPVTLLLAILIVFGLMSKNNELTIINASGISIYALVKPVLMVAVAAALFVFYLAEQIVPLTMLQSNTIQTIEIRKKTNVKVKERNIWIKGHRQITHISYFNPSSKGIFGFSRYYFDDQFRLVKRIDADRGRFEDGQWHLLGCMVQVLNPEDSVYEIKIHNDLLTDLQLHPDDFRQVIRKSEEMNIQDLRAYVSKVEKEGYDATAYRVDLYAKGAYPFVCIIMALTAIGLTARRRLDKGLPVSITYGIGIGFLYFVFHSFCVSLGYGGILPPLAAAWTANFIFLCSGLYLVLKAE
jgi:lipopolysaccharide export system permease protein